MMVIGCDYHPGFQQIAFVDTETGELQERRLQHREEAETFYHKLQEQRLRVQVSATVNPKTRLSLCTEFLHKEKHERVHDCHCRTNTPVHNDVLNLM